MGRRTGFVLLFAIALGSVLAASRYLAFGDSCMPDLLAESLTERRTAFYLHLLLGMIAMIAGPLQFFGQRRNTRAFRPEASRAHPWLGRAYVISSFAVGCTGLFLGVNAFGGTASQLGFVTLSILLLATSAMGWRAIRAGEIRSHVEWMTRSYALILSFVTIRFWQFVIPGGTSEPEAYAMATWLSFVPNAIAADVYCYRQRLALVNRRI